jgi:hypothetical protein
MSGKANENDQQLNYAINLIVNAYETKSENYELEIKKIVELYENKVKELEKNLEKSNRKREELENTIEKLVLENQNISSKYEEVVKENKKLENFKSSIFNSININELNSPPRSEKTKFPSPNILKSNIFNFHNYAANSNLSMHNRTERTNKSKESFKENSNNSIGNNRIESLIEKLNESINNRIQPAETEDPPLTKRSKLKKGILSVDIENETKDYLRKISIQNENVSNGKKIHVPSLPIQKIKNNFANNYFVANFSKSRNEDMNNKKFDSYETKQNKDEKPDEYAMSSKFFSDCRVKLNEEEYSQLIQTLKLCNNNKIDKVEALKEIESLLTNHQKLLKDFKTIFHNI